MELRFSLHKMCAANSKKEEKENEEESMSGDYEIWVLVPIHYFINHLDRLQTDAVFAMGKSCRACGKMLSESEPVWHYTGLSFYGFNCIDCGPQETP